MKANELRIGNCICKSLQSGNGRKLFQKINAHDLLRIEDDKLFNYEPIPLTEEILLKCGFKLSHKGFTYDKKRLSICLPCDSYKNGRVYFNSWCISEKSIDSLHQLQNLYFSLTNEELTFNNL